MLRNDGLAIVIQDSEILDGCERALLEEGHQVHGFRNEEDALEHLERAPIGILLTEFASGRLRRSGLIDYARRHPHLALVALLDPAERLDRVDDLDGLVYDTVPYPPETSVLLRAARRASERLALQAEVAQLKAALEQKADGGARDAFQIPSLPDAGISLQNIERELLARALEKFRGNQTRTARYLNISRRTLIYRIGKYKLRETSLRAHA